VYVYPTPGQAGGSRGYTCIGCPSVYSSATDRYTPPEIDKLHNADSLPPEALTPASIWAVTAEADNPIKRAFCQTNNIRYQVITGEQYRRFPHETIHASKQPTEQKKVVVTGCYDWLHTGHVRFFEEVSQFGELYVVVGSMQTCSC
jgi:hypothetical protein